MNRPSLCSLMRPYRQHRAERRFGRGLRRLETLAIPSSRADLLDTMALTADLASGYENRSDEVCEAWYLTAGLLRAVAASERFGVLADTWEYGDDEPQRICGPGYRDLWAALADAAVRSDRAGRACILYRLHEVIRQSPGARILADIAATEMLIAGAVPQHAPAGAS